MSAAYPTPKPRKLLLAVVVLFLALNVPSIGWAQVSVNVSTLDPVYRDIDKLVGHGLVKKIIMGQRPFSRREIARITKEAMFHVEGLKQTLNDPSISEKKKTALQARLGYIDNILQRLKSEYREELIQLGAIEGSKSWYSAHPLEKAWAEVLVTNSLPRVLNDDNGIGRIDMLTNPLLQNLQGRHLVDGANLSLETAHWFRVSDYFAVYARPRFQLGLGREGDNQPDDIKVFILNLYSKLYFKNFEVEVGRDNLFWGQGLNSGLLLSNNPRGLDMIKLSNDEPGFLPWVFKYMGANKVSFFFADLGPEQNFPNAYLVGYKWSLQPLSFFEIGASIVTQSGGDGSPEASFGERVIDTFPIVQIFSGPQVQVGNKLGGIDFRFRVPPARGLELFFEMVLDDTQSPFTNPKGFFDQDAGYVAGFYLPRVMNTGEVDLRFEFHRTGNRYYRHAQFTSGWTLNRYVMGDLLGPDSNGYYLTTSWDVDRNNLLTFHGAFELRRDDIYMLDDIPGERFDFIKIQENPDEHRYRGIVSWLFRVPDLPLQLQTNLGYEHVQNFNFVAGQSRNNFLGQATLQINLDGWTHFPR